MVLSSRVTHLRLLISLFLLIPVGPMQVVLISECRAHGSHNYEPPAAPPSRRAQDSGSNRGRFRPSQPNPGTGTGRGATARGAFSRKGRVATPQTSTWQQWWARNRYQFLDVPHAEDELLARFHARSKTSDRNALLRSRNALRRGARSHLRLYLDDRSARVRRAALIGLGLIQDHDSIETFMSALRENDQSVRCAAILALGMSRNDLARDALLDIIEDTAAGRKITGGSAVAPTLRGFALLAATMVDNQASESLTSILKKIADDRSCDDEVRAMALIGLGLSGGEEAAKHLIEFCSRRREPERLRSHAVTALSKTGETAALGDLTRLLSSGPKVVRQSAALSLGYLAQRNDTITANQLFKAYSRSSNKVLKGFSLVSMGQIGGTETLRRLEVVVKRNSSVELPWGCIGLGLALSQLPAHETPTILLQALDKCRNNSDKGAIVIALGLARCEQASEKLMELLHEGRDPNLRGYSALALGMIGDQDAITILRKAAREIHAPQVNTQAALALCLLDDTAGCNTLLELLWDSKDEASKAMAARCLLYLGDEIVVEKLLEFISTKHSNETTYLYCLELIAKMVMEHKCPFVERIANSSNFTCESPLVPTILDIGV